MKSTEIFTLALNLSEPWFVKEVKMQLPEDGKSGKIDIYIDFKRGYKFKEKKGNDSTAHDSVERQWRHLTEVPFY